MTPIRKYLQDGILPDRRDEAKKILRKVPHYTIQEGILYRRGFSSPLLRCVAGREAKEILTNIHQGGCGDHTGGQTLARKILRYGYYWPTLNKDALDFVKKCDRCQKFAKIPRLPTNEITQMTSPWPFAVWGIDLIGELPTGRGGAKYAIVAVDYFTKWVEAEPLNKISSAKVINFLIKNILCRYGVPLKIVSDNGLQFDSEEFADWCQEHGIHKSFSSVAYPQANGQVEAVNKILKTLIKKKLEKSKGAWVDELPTALWAYRTSFRTSTGHTPFSLAYGSEAMLPVETIVPSHRRIHYNPEENEELLLMSLDLIEERRNDAALKAAAHKQKVAALYNSKVKHRSLQEGDLVLRRIFPRPGALDPIWDGPYVIHKDLHNGAYILSTVDGEVFQRAWNIRHLRRYFS